MRHALLLPGCTLFLVLAGCSQPAPTTAKKEAEKPPEPVTGQSALWKMFQVARSWAPDSQVLKLDCIPLADVPEVRGKAGAWRGIFVSPSKGKSRSWTFSVVESEGNLHKGAFAGVEESWTAPRGQISPFPAIAVKIDTDAALETAMRRPEAQAYEKKNPGKPITFVLEQTKKHQDPTWRVVWGESLSTSNFSVYVDASTGDYLEIMH